MKCDSVFLPSLLLTLLLVLDFDDTITSAETTRFLPLLRITLGALCGPFPVMTQKFPEDTSFLLVFDRSTNSGVQSEFEKVHGTVINSNLFKLLVHRLNRLPSSSSFLAFSKCPNGSTVPDACSSPSTKSLQLNLNLNYVPL
jgi:hypothetical protein